MEVNLLNLRKSINKAYLKVRPNRTYIELFKKNIICLFDQIKESESEEFHKNIISEFLKNTYYSPYHYINTKGRADLVIHNGKDTHSAVGVLFETKKPGNKSEMPTKTDLNFRAFHELILYFLRERVKGNNLEVKNLIITNIFEWFIFNANDFERLFASDKNLVKKFEDFEQRRLSGLNTDFFYKYIAQPFVENIASLISVTYFDIRDFETIIKNKDTQDDNKLIALYKIFSPEHLLKLPFANDSNNLDKTFYNELLHIIGLEESKEGSKKIIGRKKQEKRYQASLIENAITILKSEDCLNQLPKRSDFGKETEDQLFNVALELSITWINRILFLKLLEGQLIKYNSGDKAFRFLNTGRVHDYDELNKLFFQVLAIKESDRNEKIKEKFSNIPYLNSSLFEPNDLEHKTIRISNLDDHFQLPVLSGTVLKDKTGKKLSGEIDPLQYLFEFLDSYDFASEGSEDIQEENKTLINASVLGLIFEKINGYKDGSFFTPGFITMYMCHETIRRAVIQKFNEAKGWNCETINSVYNKIEDIEEANKIINSLRICDPAVGSGHFLVSVLNEIIAIKSELRILSDKDGKRLKEYTVEVINDELIITDEQSNLFEYNPKSKESQRVQEALFLEKQKIIENCLFGVDINPNSVKICRLRLWIELLKNAYYISEKPVAVLETLPNIDINIKCGNSLISRYPLDADIKTALKSSKWNVDNYREAVSTYRNAQSKDEKRSMEQLISRIKNDFETEVSKSDKRYLKLNKLNGELLTLTSQSSLFEMTKTQKDDWNKKVKKLTEEINKYETEIEEIKSNRIYENAFEWRFEFPEVLNNDGDFVGFDVVIGNPPYISNWDLSERNRPLVILLENKYQPFLSGHWDIFNCFIVLANKLLAIKGLNTYILPTSFYKEKHSTKLREFFLEELEIIELLDFQQFVVFEDVARQTGIFLIRKNRNTNNKIVIKSNTIDKGRFVPQCFYLKLKNCALKTTVNEQDVLIFDKLNKNTSLLGELVCINTGVVAHAKKESNLNFTKDDVIHKVKEAGFKKYIIGSNLSPYSIRFDGDYIDYESKQTFFHRPKYPLLFDSEKIIVRRISGRNNRIIACYDVDGYYSNDNLMHLVRWNEEILKFQTPEKKWNINLDPNISLKFITAIINSNLCTYFFSKFLSTDTLQGTYSSIYPEDLRVIPIPHSNEDIKKDQIIKIVDHILLLKKSDPAADTSALESEIDHLVYELYGLTEEEIKIVEG